MHADVHQSVDRSDEEQRHREPIELAQDVSGGPAAVQDSQQRQRHVQEGGQEISHGEITQEHVGARPHATVLDDHDDDHDVAYDRDQHDNGECDGEERGRRDAPVTLPAVIARQVAHLAVVRVFVLHRDFRINPVATSSDLWTFHMHLWDIPSEFAGMS